MHSDAQPPAGLLPRRGCYPYILNHTVNGVTTTYYYITNPQGDVIRIVNTSGATVVNYYYDAWGQLRHSTDTSSSSIGTLNPLRYRGYYFDEETGFYYLQSRYYDPTLGRFINADGIASTGQGFLGYNMFAYCNNNPVNNCDPFGYQTVAGWLKEKLDEVNKRIEEEKEQVKSNPGGTSSCGVTLSGAFGIAFNFSLGIAMDSQGNIGAIVTGGVGGGTPNLSGGVFINPSTAPDIYALEGLGVETGGSIGPVGVEYNIAINSNKDGPNYSGGTVSGTVGIAPVEAHGLVTGTKVICSVNVFDLWDAFYEFASFLLGETP